MTFNSILDKLKQWGRPWAEGTEPVEIHRAVLEDIAAQVVAVGGGRRIFPFDRVEVKLLATSPAERDRLLAIVQAGWDLDREVADRLRGLGVRPPAALAVPVTVTEEATPDFGTRRYALTFRNAAAAAGREAAPASGAAPVSDAAPVGSEVVPAVREAAHAGREAAPSGREAAPAGREAAPTGRDAAPANREAGPAGSPGSASGSGGPGRPGDSAGDADAATLTDEELASAVTVAIAPPPAPAGPAPAPAPAAAAAAAPIASPAAAPIASPAVAPIAPPAAPLIAAAAIRPIAPPAAGAFPALRITVQKGQAARDTYDLAADRIYLGRLEEVLDANGRVKRRNDVAFREEGEINQTVSREHARIAWDLDSQAYWLRDEGSSAGTLIFRAGRSIEVSRHDRRGVRLQDGDEIYLGRAAIKLGLAPGRR
jgi:hypothetical protein